MLRHLRSFVWTLGIIGGILWGFCSNLSARPDLSFFVEVKSDVLQDISLNQKVIGDLQALEASLRIGLLELNEATADAVIRFQQAGIPVYAWLLLPEASGYWFNADNAASATARYEAFQTWTQKYQLSWRGVGLDIEPPMADVRAYLDQPLRFTVRAYGRLFKKNSLEAPRAAYQALLTQIKADGYPTEVYVLPPILDERVAGTHSFQRLTRTLDLLEADTEIPMVYTSASAFSSAHILAYGQPGGPIALGSTGGGVTLADGKPLKAISWADLTQDLLIAQQIANEVHIFSLEGCLEQGILAQIRDFDWQQATSLYSGEVAQAQNTRHYSRIVFRILDQPVLLSIGLLVLLLLSIWFILRLLRGFFRLFRRKKNVEDSPA